MQTQNTLPPIGPKDAHTIVRLVRLLEATRDGEPEELSSVDGLMGASMTGATLVERILPYLKEDARISLIDLAAADECHEGAFAAVTDQLEAVSRLGRRHVMERVPKRAVRIAERLLEDADAVTEDLEHAARYVGDERIAALVAERLFERSLHEWSAEASSEPPCEHDFAWEACVYGCVIIHSCRYRDEALRRLIALPWQIMYRGYILSKWDPVISVLRWCTDDDARRTIALHVADCHSPTMMAEAIVHVPFMRPQLWERFASWCRDNVPPAMPKLATDDPVDAARYARDWEEYGGGRMFVVPAARALRSISAVCPELEPEASALLKELRIEGFGS